MIRTDNGGHNFPMKMTGITDTQIGAGVLMTTTADRLEKALATVGQDLAWVGNMSMALLDLVGNGFLRISIDHIIEMTIKLQQETQLGIDGQHFQMT